MRNFWPPFVGDILIVSLLWLVIAILLCCICQGWRGHESYDNQSVLWLDTVRLYLSECVCFQFLYIAISPLYNFVHISIVQISWLSIKSYCIFMNDGSQLFISLPYQNWCNVWCLGRVLRPVSAPCGTGYIRRVFQIDEGMMPYPL